MAHFTSRLGDARLRPKYFDRTDYVVSCGNYLPLFEIAKRAMDKLLGLAIPVLNCDLPPEEKLGKLITNHIKWVLSSLRAGGVRQREKHHLPSKLYRSYTAMRDDYETIFRVVISEVLAQKTSSRLNTKLASLFILGFITSMLEWYDSSGGLSVDELASKTYPFIWSVLPNLE